VSSSGSKMQRTPKDVTPDKAVKRLENAVTAALARVELLEGEVVRMNAQGEELEGLLKGVTSGEGGPREMVAKLHILEEENRDLRRRLDEGREGVNRILAQIKFLEEQP
jgi:predicted RNase H-like nuclease (RuvC/YqgF family)